MLPQEDGAEFAELEAALTLELAPVGALQTVLARRVAVAAWRLMRADRLEAEVFAFRSYDAAGPGIALIRDGNGTRSIETLLRYRGAAMAEFWRALKTLKALQAEQAAAERETPVRPGAVARGPAAVVLDRPAAPRQQPNEPERRGHARGSGRPADHPSPGGAPRVRDPGPHTAPAVAAADAGRTSARRVAERTRDPPSGRRRAAAGIERGRPGAVVASATSAARLMASLASRDLRARHHPQRAARLPGAHPGVAPRPHHR